MTYPAWNLESMGGGLCIALMAVMHSLLAHTTVGVGLLLPLVEHQLKPAGSAPVAFHRALVRVLVAISLVLGALSGVGVWFVTAAVAPRGLATLVHRFFGAWAFEWGLFAVEVTALCLYSAYFARLPGHVRRTLAAVYAISAWLSLVVITGILSYLAHPGSAGDSDGMLAAFFSPTLVPAVVIRSALALALGSALCATLVALRGDLADRRTWLGRLGWTCAAAVALAGAAGGFWLHAIPEAAQQALAANPDHKAGFVLASVALCSAVVLAVALTLRRQRAFSLPLALSLLVASAAVLGGFEYLRETARKPYLIHGVLYANGIFKDELPALAREGLLAHAPYARRTGGSPEAVGRALFDLECRACHSPAGFHRSVQARVRRRTAAELDLLLAELGHARYPYMPPFAGTRAERRALANYLEVLGGCREALR